MKKSKIKLFRKGNFVIAGPVSGTIEKMEYVFNDGIVIILSDCEIGVDNYKPKRKIKISNYDVDQITDLVIRKNYRVSTQFYLSDKMDNFMFSDIRGYISHAKFLKITPFVDLDKRKTYIPSIKKTIKSIIKSCDDFVVVGFAGIMEFDYPKDRYYLEEPGLHLSDEDKANKEAIDVDKVVKESIEYYEKLGFINVNYLIGAYEYGASMIYPYTRAAIDVLRRMLKNEDDHIKNNADNKERLKEIKAMYKKIKGAIKEFGYKEEQERKETIKKYAEKRKVEKEISDNGND